MHKAQVKARVFKRWSKSNGSENCINFVIPVWRIVSKAKKSVLQEPIFLWISLGIARWWVYNNDFIVWKCTLAEGVFTIPLTERRTLVDSKANQEMKTVLTKNESKTITFTPNSVLVIAQDNYSEFHVEGKEILIPFYN